MIDRVLIIKSVDCTSLMLVPAGEHHHFPGTALLYTVCSALAGTATMLGALPLLYTVCSALVVLPHACTAAAPILWVLPLLYTVCSALAGTAICGTRLLLYLYALHLWTATFLSLLYTVCSALAGTDMGVLPLQYCHFCGYCRCIHCMLSR